MRYLDAGPASYSAAAILPSSFPQAQCLQDRSQCTLDASRRLGLGSSWRGLEAQRSQFTLDMSRA